MSVIEDYQGFTLNLLRVNPRKNSFIYLNSPVGAEGIRELLTRYTLILYTCSETFKYLNQKVMLKQENAKPLPYFYVGRVLTKERITRYNNNKYVLLSEKLGKPDTKSVWYTKEHIAKLLEEMNHANANGLRIYFGEYGHEEKYSGQLCLLMVMTKSEDKTGLPVDITIEDAVDFTARSLDDSGTVRDFNVGSPCPPICPGIDG